MPDQFYDPHYQYFNNHQFAQKFSNVNTILPYCYPQRNSFAYQEKFPQDQQQQIENNPVDHHSRRSWVRNIKTGDEFEVEVIENVTSPRNAVQTSDNFDFEKENIALRKENQDLLKRIGNINVVQTTKRRSISVPRHRFSPKLPLTFLYLFLYQSRQV